MGTAIVWFVTAAQLSSSCFAVRCPTSDCAKQTIVVTRKSGADENSLGNKCGLMIIDEVHLLADERGAVIESLVSRSHRLVESRQRQVRIVALSATLPNYADVAEFLQVPQRGLFFFGPEYRPVPLRQQFIGVAVKTKDRNVKEQQLNDICYEEVLDSLKRGHQVSCPCEWLALTTPYVMVLTHIEIPCRSWSLFTQERVRIFLFVLFVAHDILWLC